MAVSHVKFPTHVYFVCVNHALSTEREEIGGLIVGQVENRVADISAVILLRRSDKRKDRVEISPEQLCNASTEAERMSVILKKTVRVIGWYHSHPKVAVWPSDIDMNTQANHQFMDESFIGLIFSVFNEDPSRKGGRIMLTCYQSRSIIRGRLTDKKRRDIPIHIVPSNYIDYLNLTALIQLPNLLCEEEQLAYQAARNMNLDFLTTLYSSSVYIRARDQIAEIVCGPLVKMLEERILNNDMKQKQLLSLKEGKMTLLEQLKKEVAELKFTAEASPDLAAKFGHDLSLDTRRVPEAAAKKSFLTLSSSFEETPVVVNLLKSSASSESIANCRRQADVQELTSILDSESFMKEDNLPGPSRNLPGTSRSFPGPSPYVPGFPHIESETEKSDAQVPVSSAAQGEDVEFQFESPPESPESSV